MARRRKDVEIVHVYNFEFRRWDRYEFKKPKKKGRGK